MIYVKDPPMRILESVRETNWRWFTCIRCGIRHMVRYKRPDYICRDCQLSDPEYVTMIRDKERTVA